jgi:tRNA-splicing endonuclease subunit Sen54
MSSFNIYTVFVQILLFLPHFLITVLSVLPTWFVPHRPHRPYNKIYATLPPISTYSTLSEGYSTDLKIALHAWRPSPQWKRRAPGPPDFHICVLDSRDPFPSLHQLESLYASVAQEHQVGKGRGKVLLAVVDRGASNYISLDDTLGGDTIAKMGD